MVNLVILLFSERSHGDSESVGRKHCGVCSKEQDFSHVVETNYFCLFGLRLLPIEKIANYLRCDQCRNSFMINQTDEPTQIALVKSVLIYVLSGYGLHNHRELIQDICIKVTGFEYHEDEITGEMNSVSRGDSDVFALLKSSASTLNVQGKQQILESAFLAIHACCEIQYEDRLRINLMGNALGVSIQFVNSVIDQVHANGCYQVRRLLSSQLKQPNA